MGDEPGGVDAPDAPHVHDGPQQEQLGQPLFDTQQELSDHLEQVMDSLVEHLPEVPVPGPDVPQTLAAKSTGPATLPPAAVESKWGDRKGDFMPTPPVPTPCRTGASTPCIDHAQDPLRSLRAYEERVLIYKSWILQGCVIYVFVVYFL